MNIRFERGFSRAPLVIFILLQFAATTGYPATAQDRLAGAQRPVFEGGSFRIVSEFPVERRQVEKLHRLAVSAYHFAIAHSKGAEQVAAAKPVTLHIISKEDMRKKMQGAAAVTVGPDDVFIGSKALNPDPVQFGGVLAHELTHLLHNRMGGHLPRFLEEGFAGCVQYRYILEAGRTTAESLKQMRRSYNFTTGVDARLARHVVDDVIAGFGGDNQKPQGINKDEVTGQLFVEFLRTRLMQHGAPQVFEKLSAIISALPKDLKVKSPDYMPQFTSQFEQQFGVPWPQAKGEFVAYIRRTENKPRRRLQGTIWEANPFNR